MQIQSSFVSAKAASVCVCSPIIRVKSLYYTQKITHDDPSSAGSMAAPPPPAPKWSQKTITLPPQRRGCHLITPKVLKEIGQDLSGFKCGLAHLFLQHTSASLTINENYDSDVRDDTETFLNSIVPEGMSAPWKHTLEGFQLRMASLTWELGRAYGCASTETKLLHAKLWSLLMEFKVLKLRDLTFKSLTLIFL
ncbi:hypothetical protein CsSME_00013303 [Camellia sinensis var. sinensis]